MCWRGRPVYRRRQIGKILSTAVLVLGVLFFVLVLEGLVFRGMKYVFHLDFSQEYRQVDEIGQLRFWDGWSGKVYIRYPFGLRPIEEREDVLEEEKPAISPDGRYLLVCEIDYGGEITDDEYCYYRVIDLEDGTQYTVYAGYREWFLVYWEQSL